MMLSNVCVTLSVVFIAKSICVYLVEKPAGSTIILSCSSEHYLPMSLSNNHLWWFNKQILFTSQFKPTDIGFTNVNGTIYNETFSFVEIHKFSIPNEGIYQCIIENYVLSSFHLELTGSMIVKVVSRGVGVSLTCNLRGTHIWQFNDAIIVADSFQPSDIGLVNVHFEHVNSTLSRVHINNTMLKNAGKYSCTAVGESGGVKYFVIVQDTQLHLSISGRNISEFRFLITDVKYKVTCALSGNVEKRENRITMMTFQRSKKGHFTGYLSGTVAGSNEISLNAMFASNTLQSVFVCVGLDEHGNEFDKKSHELDVLVVPVLVIRMEGLNMSDRYQAYVGEVLILTCVAFGSRPAVDLYWMKGKGNISNVAIATKSNKFKKFTNDTENQLRIGVEQSMVLTCYSNGLSEFHMKEVSLIVEVRRVREFRYIVVVGSISVTVILIVSISFYTRLRLQKKRRENAELFALSVWQEATSSGANGEIPTDTPVTINKFDSLPEHETLAETDAYSDSGVGVIRNDYATSCETVKIMTHLHCGDNIDYWLGKYFLRDGDIDCICEVVSDNAQMKDGYNFLTRAESLRSLQSHSNIVSYLGSSTEKSYVPYYLYREYVDCGTLRDYLLQNYNSHRSSDVPRNTISVDLLENKPHPIMFAGDVAYAMDFLHSERFHHPALSARKVLLSNTLVCKLFDFWPSELSTERATNLMKNSNPPTAWLPPETVFLDQYSALSDVWAYGILLWEIFSLGETPFQFKNRKEIEDDIRNMKLPSQPQNCPGAVFGIMLSTWKKYPDSRPSFADIKDEIKSLHDAFKTGAQKTDNWNEWNLEYFTLEAEQYPDPHYSLPLKYS